MQTGTLLTGFITSLAIVLLAIPSIVTVARRKGLYGAVRERDTGSPEVPTLGGLAIFAGTILSLSLYADVETMPELNYFIAGALVLFFIGLKDDVLVTAPLWKLTGQLLVALIIAMPGGLRIHQPGSFIGLEIDGEALEVLVTIMVMVAVVNSVNLIDGIDGLASGIGIFTSLIFGCIFYREGLLEWALMAAILCGGLAGFAGYNVFGQRNKILMGDTGSLLLGFILSLMTIRFLNLEKAILWKWQVTAPLALTLAVLIVPLFDTLRIILVRLLHGRSPLRPDRKHIHYRMIDLGFTHLQASGLLIGVNLIMVLLALVLQDMGELPLILMLLLLSGLLSLIPGYYLRRKRRKT